MNTYRLKLAAFGSELIDTVVIDTVTPWWTAHMAKESLSRYAPRPWGMQPNTSLWRLIATTCAVFGPCLCAYYTIFGVSAASPQHFHWESCTIQ